MQQSDDTVRRIAAELLNVFRMITDFAEWYFRSVHPGNVLSACAVQAGAFDESEEYDQRDLRNPPSFGRGTPNNMLETNLSPYKLSRHRNTTVIISDPDSSESIRDGGGRNIQTLVNEPLYKMKAELSHWASRVNAMTININKEQQMIQVMNGTRSGYQSTSRSSIIHPSNSLLQQTFQSSTSPAVSELQRSVGIMQGLLAVLFDDIQETERMGSERFDNVSRYLANEQKLRVQQGQLHGDMMDAIQQQLNEAEDREKIRRKSDTERIQLNSDTIIRLREDIQHLEDTSKTLREEGDVNKEKLDAKEIEYQTIQEENQKLAVEISLKMQEKEQLLLRVKEFGDRAEIKENETRQMAKELTQEHELRIRSEEKAQKLEEERIERDRERIELKNALQSAERELMELRPLRGKDIELAEEKKAREAADRTIDVIRRDKDRLEMRVTQLTRSVDERQAQLEQTSKECTAFKERLFHNELQLKKKERTAQDARSRAEELEHELSTCEEKRRTAEYNVEVESNRAELMARVLASRDTKIGELEGAVGVFEREKIDATNRAWQAERDAAALRTEVQALQSRLTNTGLFGNSPSKWSRGGKSQVIQESDESSSDEETSGSEEN